MAHYLSCTVESGMASSEPPALIVGTRSLGHRATCVQRDVRSLAPAVLAMPVDVTTLGGSEVRRQRVAERGSESSVARSKQGQVFLMGALMGRLMIDDASAAALREAADVFFVDFVLYPHSGPICTTWYYFHLLNYYHDPQCS